MVFTSTQLTDSVTMDTSKCWFVPESQLNAPARLQPIVSVIENPEDIIKPGSPLLITLETFCINKNHDESHRVVDEDRRPRGQIEDKNDLLVRTRVKYGSEPLTESINFFELDVPAGKVNMDLLSEFIFSQESYSEKKRIWLEVEILEVDKGLRDNETLLEDLGGLKTEFGAIFPSLFPFSLMVGGAAKLAKLAALQESNEEVFRSHIDLLYALSHSAKGEAPLRPGAYIFFNELVKPVEASQYQLRKLELEYFTPSEREKNSPVRDDYVVIKMAPEIIEMGDSQDLRENQQLARILSHANEKDDESIRIEQRKVLKDFVGDALKFQDLGSFIDLKEMKELGTPLNDQQMQRFLELSKRLREVISALK